MNTSPTTVERLRQLLTISLDCPRIEELEKLPDVTDVQNTLYWKIPNYRLAFDLFDEKYPNERDTDKWKKLRQGYNIAHSDFEKDFNQKIDALTTKRKSRLTYLKRLFEDLYSGSARYRSQDRVASYLRSDKFKSIKTQIDTDLWDRLDEIGYAVWQSSLHGRFIDLTLERAFMLEGEPIKHGYLWKEADPSPTDAPTPDAPTSTETTYGVYDVAVIPALATSASPANDAPEAQQKTALIEWFAMPGKYPIVMGLLVERGLCQPGTYLWIDESGGAKTAVATLIKHLYAQGFYTDNTKPSNKEIIGIAKQTFGVAISLDTIKKARVPTSANHNLSFIRPASTY